MKTMTRQILKFNFINGGGSGTLRRLDNILVSVVDAQIFIFDVVGDDVVAAVPSRRFSPSPKIVDRATSKARKWSE